MQLELIEAVLSQAPGAFTIADSESLEYVYVNEEAARLWGLPREQVMRLGPAGVAARSPAAASLEEGYAQLVARAPASSVDVARVTRRDGRELVCEFHSRALRVGDRWLVATNIRAVTQEEPGEQQTLELVQSAVDEAGDAVVVIDLQTSRYLYVNNMAARLAEMDRAEMMKAGPLQVMGRAASGYDIESMRQKVLACYPQSSVEEASLTRADGSIMRGEFTRRAVRLPDRWIMITVVRDVSERRATQARLELFKRALDDADEGIYLIDPQRLAFLDVNERACQLVGAPREELMAKGPLGWDFSAEDLKRRYAEVIAAFPGTVVEEFHRQRAGGDTIIVEKSRRAMRSDDGWLIIIHERDITQRKAAERMLQQHVQELARSNKDLEQFAYVISHDLSEPLRMMASYAQLLQRRYGDRLDADAGDFIGFIVDGATRMKLLIDALLLYSRAGRSRAPAQPLALAAPLKDALANLARAIEDAHATIDAGPLPTVQAEPAAMMQLFQNLVGNALKFRGAAAPIVRIRCEERDSDWELSVSDNGIGIDPRYFERIFVVFQRLHARTEYEGAGIGLSICKKIVERHGGRIWVESEPGAGTTFRFTLPKKRVATDEEG